MVAAISPTVRTRLRSLRRRLGGTPVFRFMEFSGIGAVAAAIVVALTLVTLAAPLLTRYGDTEIVQGVVVSHGEIVVTMPGGAREVRGLLPGENEFTASFDLRSRNPGAMVAFHEVTEVVYQFTGDDVRDAASVVATYKSRYPDAFRVQARPLVLEPPGGRFLLGTDELGRDVWARVLYGGRVSLQVGLFATLIACVLGTALGTVSGFVGGWVDMIVQRFVDAINAFPGLVLALALASIIGQGVWNLIFLLGFLNVPGVVRLVRGIVLSTKENVYVEAARATGSSDLRIMTRHVLPSVWQPVCVVAGLLLGGVIIIEASLSFLGVGVPLPAPSWGGMLSSSRRFFETAWWLAVFPGVALSLAVLGFNLLGDALRDFLDPRLGRS